jgi:hypothetical protein
MPKQRKHKTQAIQLNVGNDPALWRFDSLQQAIQANTDLLAQIIHANGQDEQVDIGIEATSSGKEDANQQTQEQDHSEFSD